MDKLETQIRRIEKKLDRLQIRFDKLRAERDAALADAKRERAANGVVGLALDACMKERDAYRKRAEEQ